MNLFVPYQILIVLCVAIQSIAAYRLDNRLNTDSNNVDHAALGGVEITEAGKHILARINEARAAKYSNLRVVNMDQDEAIEENLMGRTITNNCYAVAAGNIVFAIAGKHEVTIGEKAFMLTDSIVEVEIKYEFFLGPLYFGVYTTKP
ncbi:unnamed protein product [Medioppia subpectinata]|uniref:Uncharacterized protein n=1 Tax=Medioppia subpectinata TaxID=1979941 RepID=A0A7R9Q7B1_9ACAR|nr:unnamed protein product [Medioppia subpectinata]CAG2114625.1 unnamed protein product [Medioppia subpectinata]